MVRGGVGTIGFFCFNIAICFVFRWVFQIVLCRFVLLLLILIFSRVSVVSGSAFRVVPFVVHPSVCGSSSWKDSWRERFRVTSLSVS